MIFRSDSLSRDIDRFLAEDEKALKSLPRCSECDKPISDDFCYQINGELICEDCMQTFRKHTEDFME